MRAIHLYIRDLGGEFDSGRFTELAESLGKTVSESTARVYSEYFVASELAPIRVKRSEITVGAEGTTLLLTSYIKLFSYGVAVFEYQVDLSGNPLQPSQLFWTRTFDFPDEGQTLLEHVYKRDVDRLEPVLLKNLKKEYHAPPFNDRFHLLSIDQALGQDEARRILLPNDENVPLTQKRSPVRTIDLGEGETLLISGNQGVLATTVNYSDVVNFLELSRVQLFELKVYDHILDRSIEKTYDFLDRLPVTDRLMPLAWLRKDFRMQVRQVLRLTAIRMDLVDLVKDITNTTKVTDDSYFEALYFKLNETFNIQEWFASVKEKIEEIEDVQRMIVDRVDLAKSTALEVTVIILILVEILFPLFELLFGK